jgi:hypothetical protein
VSSLAREVAGESVELESKTRPSRKKPPFTAESVGGELGAVRVETRRKLPLVKTGG